MASCARCFINVNFNPSVKLKGRVFPPFHRRERRGQVVTQLTVQPRHEPRAVHCSACVTGQNSAETDPSRSPRQAGSFTKHPEDPVVCEHAYTREGILTWMVTRGPPSCNTWDWMPRGFQAAVSTGSIPRAWPLLIPRSFEVLSSAGLH